MAKSDLLLRLGLDDAALKRQLNTLNRSLNTTFSKLGSRLESIGQDLSLRVTAPIAAAGVASVRTFAQFDKLEKGLTAITGSADEARKQFASLQGIVADTRTSLDLQTAARAALQLQGVGVSADDAQRAIKALGIAATLSGAAADDVGEVARQFSQASAKGVIMQEELSVALERLPALAGVIKKEFGTVTAEGLRDAGVSASDFVKRLVIAIETNEKFQNVQGGLSKSFESFNTSLQIAGAELGKTISETIGLENILNKLSDTISAVVRGFSDLSPATKTIILGVAGLAASIGPLSFAMGAVIKTLPLLKVGFAAVVNPFGLATKAVVGLKAAFTALLTPIGLVSASIVAIAALTVVAMNKIRTSTDAAGRAQATLNETTERATQLADEERKKVNSLVGVLRDETKTKGEKAEALEMLRRLNPGYFEGLDIEKSKLGEIVEASQKYNTALEKTIALRELNARSLQAQNELEKVNEQLAKKVPTNRLEAIGTIIANGGNALGAFQGIAELQRNKNALEATINAIAEETQRIASAAVETGDEEGGGGQPVVTVDKGVKKIIEDTNKALSAIEGRFKLFGNASEATKEKIKVLQKGITDLLEEGLAPTSPQVQNLVTQLQALQVPVDQVANLGLKDLNSGLQETERLAQSGFAQLIADDFEKMADKVTIAKNPFAELAAQFEVLESKSAVFGESFNLLEEQLNAVKSALTSALEEGYGPTDSIVESLTLKMQGLTEELEKQKSVMENMVTVSDAYSSAFESAANSQEAGFKGVGKAALAAARDVVKAKLLEATVSFVADAFAKFGIFGAIAAAGAGAIVGGVFSKVSSALNIPQFADGAYVTKPTLALFGEAGPEYAVPKPDFDRIANNAGGPIYVEHVIRGEDLLLIIQRAQNAQNRIF